MKIQRFTTVCVVLLAALCWAQPATAQSTECQCNCYFSGDCPLQGQQFCNWGNLSVQDSCWWRQPKPQGVAGAGCDQDYVDWGRCDGICDPAARSTLLVNEDINTVEKGVRAWAEALTGQGLDGGGTLSVDWLKHVGTVEFSTPDSSYNIWRVTLEAIMLVRGFDAFQFPQGEAFTEYSVGVAPLGRDSVTYTNGQLAVEVLLAEMKEEGSGQRFIAAMNPDALDHKMLGRMCDGAPDVLTCLHWRLGTLADVLSRAGRGGSDGGGDRGVDCMGCYGDCNPDDVVDLFDLLAVIDDWNRTDLPMTDIDQNGIVNLFDLLDLIDNWGRCVPMGPP